MPTADELRHMNLDLFERLLEHTSDPQERARIERLIEEERAKPDSEYPASHSGWEPHQH
jgi:hypothetical protein